MPQDPSKLFIDINQDPGLTIGSGTPDANYTLQYANVDTNQPVINIFNYTLETAGSNSEVLFSKNGKATGDPQFSYNPNTNILTVETLNLTNSANLGTVGNIKITGGTDGYVLKTDGNGNLSWTSQQLASTSWNAVIDKPDFADVATSGDYNDLTNIPSIPSISGLASETFVNNKIANVTWGNVPGKPTFATVATSGRYSDLLFPPNLKAVALSGSYTDLLNAPSIPSIDGLATTTYVNTKVGQVTYASLSDTPTLANVATTGKYEDLRWPVYPTEGDLPNASINHGMFAHVHSTGHGYIAHAGSWIMLGNFNDIPTTFPGANVTGYVANASHSNVADSANAIAGANVSGAVNLATHATTANSVAWANVSGKPTKVSDFTNDSGFITSSSLPDLSGYVTGTPWTSEGYLTSADLSGYVTGTPWTSEGYVTGTPWTSEGYVTGTPWTSEGYLTSVTTTLDNSSVGDMDIMVYDGNIKYTSNVTIDVSNGTLKAKIFSGNGSSLTSLAGANVTGTVANATIAGSANAVAWANVSDKPAFYSNTNAGAYLTSYSGNITANIITANIHASPTNSNLTLQTHAIYNITTITNGGTTYTSGSGTPTTGGSGVGMTVNINQSGGVVDLVIVNNPGTGYANGDTITVLGGDGTATFTIANYSATGTDVTKNWIFSKDGNLTAPGNIRMSNIGGIYSSSAGYTVGLKMSNTEPSVKLVAHNHEWMFDSNGVLKFPAGYSTTYPSITMGEPGNLLIQGYLNASFSEDGGNVIVSGGFGDGNNGNAIVLGQQVIVQAQLSATNGSPKYSWTFDADGNLSVPGGGSVYSVGAGTAGITANIASGNAYLGLDDTDRTATLFGNAGVQIGTHSGVAWNFSASGNLTLPAGGDILDSTGTSVLGVSTYGNSNVVSLMNAFDGNPISNVGSIQFNGGTKYIYMDTSTSGAKLTMHWNEAQSIELGEDGINLTTYTGTASDYNHWTLSTTGNLTLPSGGVIRETSIPGGGLDGNTIALKPEGGINDNQQLLIYPTGGADYNHLHLTSGNLYTTELYLGNDDLYVKINNNGNIVINSNDNIGNTAQWNFKTDGAVLATKELKLKVLNGIPTGVTKTTNNQGWDNSKVGTNLPTTGGSGTGLTVDVVDGGSYYSIISINTPGSGYNIGDIITVSNGGMSDSFTIDITGTKTWEFDMTGNLILPAGGDIKNSTGTSQYISLSSLKTLVADSTDFADFQTRIAAL